MKIQVIFKWYSLMQSKDQRDEANQPQQISAFHDKWYSFHMGKGWYSLSSPSYYNWTS